MRPHDSDPHPQDTEGCAAPAQAGTAFDGLDRLLAAPHRWDCSDAVQHWLARCDEGDWQSLADAWGRRESRWRESLAWVLAQAAPPRAAVLLRQGLFDPDPAVARQSAASLALLRRRHGEALSLDSAMIARLADLAIAPRGRPLPDVVELLGQLRGG